MPIATLYQDLIKEVIVQLKTITELTGTPNVPRVSKWKATRNPVPGAYEAVVMAGPMTIIGGATVKSNNVEFQIIIDLIYYSIDTGGTGFDTGFDNAMAVAEKVYDQFSRTNINSNVRIVKAVNIFPGDGTISGRNLLAIPIRIQLISEKIITQ